MWKTLLKNKMFWVYVSFLNVAFFGGLYVWLGVEWFMYPVFASFSYLAVLGVIMFVYAIINTIKDLKE